MIPQESEKEVFQDDERYINTGKIERAAVRAVEGFIEMCPKLMPIISTNDKTPIWDGDIFVYKSEKHVIKNFSARVPLQVKGTTNTKDDFYRIERKYLESFKNDRGCVFFLVQEDENYNPSKILYAKLSSAELDVRLEKDTHTIKIELKEVPANPNDFENEIFEFARKRNGEKIENPATNEIKSLVEEFEIVEKHLNEIEDFGARYDLESLLNIIKKLKDDGSIGWRDKFIYYSQKAIGLAINNIKKSDFINLQFKFGTYLHEQKLYNLAEDYYDNLLGILCNFTTEQDYEIMSNIATILNNLACLYNDQNHYYESERQHKKALEIRRNLVKNNQDENIEDIAQTLGNLANLHAEHNRPIEAEKEYKEALKIYRGLAKDTPDTYMDNVALILSNLANLHTNLQQYYEAEREYREVLEIYRKLAKDNSNVYKDYLAWSLNGLAILHNHLNRTVEAEEEYKESLDIYRELVKDNQSIYKEYLARSLNNLGILLSEHYRYSEAEEKYMEALEIFRELAKDNPDIYMDGIAWTLNNIAALNEDLNHPVKAEEKYKEALVIYRKVAKENPAKYTRMVAQIINNIASLHNDHNRLKEAEKEYQEALEIYRGLAKDNPTAYMSKVSDTLNSLAYLYAKQNYFSKAIDTINEAIACMPSDAEYYDTKGEILLMKGDEQDALAMWRKVMELDPDFLSKYDGETELHRQLKEKGLIDK